MMSADLRPRMKKREPWAEACEGRDERPAEEMGRRGATSPVRNHGDGFGSEGEAGVNSAEVAAGLRQYSRKMVGPRSWISPWRSVSEGSMTVFVSVSTRRASTEGSGQPTEASTRSEGSRPQERAMPTSVIP